MLAKASSMNEAMELSIPRSGLVRRSILPLALFAVAAHAASRPTALDRYVAAPDSNYRYSLAATIPGKGYTAYILDLASQEWRSAGEVDRPIWKHWLTIVRPDAVASATGFLFIDGGNNRSSAPVRPNASIVAMATSSGSVAAEIGQIPSEPLVFAGDGKKRSEDAIIAFTWDKFLRGGDDNWPLRLPMTKAVVRALDTITAFSKTPAGGAIAVDRFVVAGGSKRGWTTWTAAAVDKRVVAIAPLVIDMLNVERSFAHHYRAYGFWAPAVKDYQDLNLMDAMGSKRYRQLMKIVEPYSYRDRLVMPKYIVNASGDQFFLPDSSQFYWSALKGEKYLRYVPNANHSLAGTDVEESLLAFYGSVVSGTPRPRLTWKFERDGSIRVVTKTKPSEVKLWQATNPKARDFRVESIGKAYRSSTLGDRGGGLYTAKVERPSTGYTAFFIELSYLVGNHLMKVTSGVRITPDTLPFGPPPHGEAR